MIKEHLWTSIVRASSPGDRKSLKNKVLEAMTLWKAKWKNGKALKDKTVLQLVRDLRAEKGLRYIGFTPSIKYFFADGTKEQLSSDWEHPFGGPVLVYAHKHLPLILLAGADLRHNDSFVKELNPDMMKDSIGGFTD